MYLGVWDMRAMSGSSLKVLVTDMFILVRNHELHNLWNKYKKKCMPFLGSKTGQFYIFAIKIET
jgi:hypothetical protein